MSTESKLSKQQKEILKILYERAKEDKGIDGRKLNRIISNNNLSDSKRASLSRTMKRLIERKLVFRRKNYYSEALGCWIKCDVWFITDRGINVYNKIEKVNKKIRGEKS